MQLFKCPITGIGRAQNVRFGHKSGTLLLSSYDKLQGAYSDLTLLGNARFLFYARFGHLAASLSLVILNDSEGTARQKSEDDDTYTSEIGNNQNFSPGPN